MTEIVAFDKYDTLGAYHWIECDRRLINWKRYNPALDARYQITVRAIRELGLQGRLLDIGCGDGLLMARLAPFVRRAVGVDSDETAIRLAYQKLGTFANCEIIYGSSYELPFGPDSFDIVVSADVIEHLKDPALHLHEICRLLQPEGALVLTTPKWRPDRKWDVRHEKEYRADELRALLVEYFQDVRLNFFWPKRASHLYQTKLGWRYLKLLAVLFHNSFDRVGSDPENFGQILAICRNPLQQSTGKDS